MSNFIPPRPGWHRDLPDPRDYSPAHPAVRSLLDKLPAASARPPRADWREYCPPVADQKGLACCTSHAGVGLLEYFERRARGRLLDGSCLFLYAMTRRLLLCPGDTGANLRTTLKALVRFGLPPARHWPYDPRRCDEEPAAFLFAFAREFQSLLYVRLDPAGVPGAAALQRVKAFLAAGFPSVFGLTAFTSLSAEADIPFPTQYDAVRGGYALAAVGYDDRRRIRSARGSLLVRNCWGPEWGEDGYGWLPYAYVEQQLAVDFWTLVGEDWLASGEFENPG
jgi:C1A family cysteine protease